MRRASSCAVPAGEVFDVAVDMRRRLADLRAPCRLRRCRRRTTGCCGFRPASRTASSSCPTSAEFLYKTTDYWYPEHERTLLWNDPALGHRLAGRHRADARSQGRGWNAASPRPMLTVDASDVTGARPTILLTGAGGQLGRELAAALPACGTVIACDRAALDLRLPAMIEHVVRSVAPQFIVNAAAYTAVDRAEAERDLAFAVNADAPAVLASEAKRAGAVLFHYSTDYVFDGANTAPYDEDAHANPQNVYGMSKLAGEQAVHASGALALTLRTSWVYSRHGSNFLTTMQKLAAERDELRIVADQTGVPNWARAIAGATATLIQRGQRVHRRPCRALSPERKRIHDVVRVRARNRGRHACARDADHDVGIPDAGEAAGVRRTRCNPLCTHIRVCASRLANVVTGLPSIARGTAACRSTDGPLVSAMPPGRALYGSHARDSLRSCYMNCNRESSTPFALYQFPDSGALKRCLT